MFHGTSDQTVQKGHKPFKEVIKKHNSRQFGPAVD